MKINNEQIKVLYDYWNDYFGINIKIPNDVVLVSEQLFENYLSDLIKIKIYDYYFIDKICLYDNNKIIDYQGIKEIHSQRELFKLLNNYSIIITTNCNLSEYKDKVILRKEIIENIFTSNHTHFFSKELPFSYENNKVFFTNKFYELLIDDVERFDHLIFNSKLLNNFEKGNRYSDNVFIKPKINISTYGRWYFSNCPIQNNTEYRNKIINDIGKDNILTIDLVSGEPSYFSNLTNSTTLKSLIMYRMTLDKNEKYISDLFKNLMNIFLHSLLSPEQSFKWLYRDNKEDIDNYYNQTERPYYDILKLYNLINDETLWYNNKVINDYKNNLSVVENNRRIVNPFSIIQNEKELLKEHRKYLQAGTQDTINNICNTVNHNFNIMPIFTIFDSVTFKIEKEKKDKVKKKIEEYLFNKYFIQEEI